MSVFDFFLNGGLLGKLRGYDYEEEGHIYGFDEFCEDVPKVGLGVRETMSIANEINNGLGGSNLGKLGFGGEDE